MSGTLYKNLRKCQPAFRKQFDDSFFGSGLFRGEWNTIIRTVTDNASKQERRDLKTKYLALVAMTPLFFFAALGPFIDQMLWDFGDPFSMRIPLSSVMWNISLFGLIALCGGIAFLTSMRKENPSWYLGIPLVVAYATIAITPVVAGFFVIYDPSPPLFHPGIVLSLLAAYGTVFLLPPCAALFFWSQRQQGWWPAVMAGIALLITLNSLVLTFYIFSPYLVSAGLISPPPPQYIDGQLVKTDGEGILFLFVHLMIGLPVIGICIIALAGYTWYTTKKAAPAPSPEAQS